ncbi:MAG: ferredoxin [Nanoarchaeota archaeon]|nr:ferredoxin [Nanoarchaeota archaeon]MBU1854534.1 ferredoxin [Nanoarchaeota archaeon]
MTKYKVEHEIEECIGCGACAAISSNWEMVDVDGEEKSQILKSEINDSELEDNKQAAESCPVAIIHITNLDTDEKII